MPSSPSLEQLVDMLAQSLRLRQAGQHQAALDGLNAALAQHPLFLPALAAKCELLTHLGRYDEAIEAIDMALTLAPGAELPAALRQKLLEEGDHILAQRLLADPHDVDALFQQGNLAMSRKDHAAAITAFEAVLTLQPERASARNNLGNNLLACNRPGEALACYDRIIAGNPRDLRAWYNRGNALQQMGQTAEALESYLSVIKIDPQLGEARMEAAHCLLRLERYTEGWPLFEARWQTGQMRHAWLNSVQPVWHGDQPLRDKTLLVWTEQGLGDSIQFARFLPAVAELGAQIILRCPSSLHKLFATLDTRITLVSDTVDLPQHDCHCPLMSLPLVLNTGTATTGHHAYLRADPAVIARWQEKLGPASRMRIGINWTGRQYGRRNPTRDVPVAALAPLFALNADFIVLQKDLPDADAAFLAGFDNVFCLGPQLGDFADTAALTGCTDRVITTDTSVAHLAGALGRRGDVLLRFQGDWRWLPDRERAAWYPSLRQRFQTRPGDWNDIIIDITQDVAAGLS